MKKVVMKNRPEGFLGTEFIAPDSEQFDYIRELHECLWHFVRTVIPGASGDLKDFVDLALERSEEVARMNLNLTAEMREQLRNMIVLSVDEEISHLERLRLQVLETITECWTEVHRLDVKLEKLMEMKRSEDDSR